MNKTLATTLTLFSTLVLMAQQPNTVTIRIIETSDVHGAFFPHDFTEDSPMPGTMARVSTYINQQRQKYGKNLILLDNGDILQGQPTNYYTNFVKTNETNIAAEVMNYLKYDAQSFGNHDIETGHAVYDKWIRELHCPTLGANVINLKSGKPYTEPYLMLERQGVRIAVLGMLTPAIPNWLHQSLWSGMKFEEMVDCARKWVKTLREKEQADVVVGLFHSGWDGGIHTADYDEDVTRRIAEETEGFDVLFFGHDHRVRHTMVKGVLCLDPANNAVNVAQATITLKRSGKSGAKSSWHITSKKGEIVDITREAVDEAYINHFKSQIDSIQTFVQEEIGTFLAPMHASDAFFGSSSFIDYVHEMQLEHTGADISFNAPLQSTSVINAGPVHMSDMFKLYRFENQIYVLRMTGREVRRHLEMSYDQWVNTMLSADDHILLLDLAEGDNQHNRFKYYTFNFDSALGIDYEVDVTKPDGHKVRILQFSDGRPFKEEEWYRVAMNSYRGNGGGELLSRGAGIPFDSIPSRIIYMSPYDQRHYLTQRIRQTGQVTPKAHHNWRFVPEEWARPALERDRRLLFGK